MSGAAQKRSPLAIVLFASLAIALGQSSSLFAASINYGNFAGTTVNYIGVTEAANSVGDAPPLFGPPTVAGDSLNFSPVGFSASSAAPGGGIDVTDGNLNFMAVAKPGFFLPTLIISEVGDTTLAGFGNDSTFTSVSMRGNAVINMIDNVGVNFIIVPITMNFAPSGGTFGLATDGGGGPLFNTAWSGTAVVNLQAAVIASGLPFINGATKVTVNFDNTLVAINQAGTSALIAKKGTNSVIITIPGTPEGNIPEPTAALLAMIGLAVVGGMRSSRR